MCTFYGHLIRGQWSGVYPNCADCGVEITSPDQLRTATLKKFNRR